MYRDIVQRLALDLRHYETVIAIIEFGTMTEAARQLATTQSALSHRLAEAERRLGTSLFSRTSSRRLVPTRHGLALHQAATRAFDDLGRTEATVLDSQPLAPTTLRIAVGSYDCYHWFPSFLAYVRESQHNIDLELSVVGDAPGPALSSQAVDLVVAPGQPGGDIDLHPLFEDDLALFTHPEHELASADFVEADDLASETYLTYNASPSPGFEYDRFIRPARAYPQVVRVVRQTSAIAELVAAGAGVSILSRWALEPILQAGRVRAITCGEGLPLLWHGAFRRGDLAAQLVAEQLAEHLQPRTPVG